MKLNALARPGPKLGLSSAPLRSEFSPLRLWLALFLGLCCSLMGSVAAQAQNYSDIWWDPSEGGWGLSLADHDTRLYGVLYTYAPDGRPVWYVIPSGTFTETKRFFVGDIYETSGSPYNAAFNANQVNMVKVGTARLDFAPPGLPAGTALLSSTIGSLTETKQVQRFAFGNAAPNWGTDVTDLWWTAAEPDWGLALAQHGNDVFGVWYTYDTWGNSQWIVMPNVTFSGPNSFSGTLFTTTGPGFGSNSYDPTQVAATPVGSATVNVAGDRATFTSTVNGLMQSKTITRLPFGSGLLAATCSSPAIGAVPVLFTASPIDPNAIEWISPLGNLNPPGHALPTDHIYFYFADPDARESWVDRRTAVLAPADGTVADIFQGGPNSTDIKVFVNVSATLSYYVDHVIPDYPIARGTRLAAGQRIGTTGSAYAIDLGVVNHALTQGFANLSRYIAGETLHGDAPLKYYDEPLRSQLYGKVRRIGTECDGTFNYDVAGRLSGNWFSGGGTTPLAFAYDTYDPSQVRISVPYGLKPHVNGGTVAIAPGDPLPRDVSAASGKVLYTLTTSRTGLPLRGDPVGRLLVQMVDDTHIRVEMFSMSDSAADFTGNALIFAR
ncbi:MAG: hypothetical protein HYR63_21620 [Proteobacteria bacterium]|nr:hypothetical protein [Pseudomonadota bacterium]